MLEQGLRILVQQSPPIEEVEDILGRSRGLTLPDQFVESLLKPVHISRSDLYK